MADRLPEDAANNTGQYPGGHGHLLEQFRDIEGYVLASNNECYWTLATSRDEYETLVATAF